jgi:hypothetical protein
VCSVGPSGFRDGVECPVRGQELTEGSDKAGRERKRWGLIDSVSGGGDEGWRVLRLRISQSARDRPLRMTDLGRVRRGCRAERAPEAEVRVGGVWTRG